MCPRGGTIGMTKHRSFTPEFKAREEQQHPALLRTAEAASFGYNNFRRAFRNHLREDRE
jgi:hypothetical protein